MLVKAKWNVKDATGWHTAGEVFNTENELGEAVEVLEAPKRTNARKQEPVKAEEPEPEAKPGEPEPEKAEGQKSASRRKKAGA